MDIGILVVLSTATQLLIHQPRCLSLGYNLHFTEEAAETQLAGLFECQPKVELKKLLLVLLQSSVIRLYIARPDSMDKWHVDVGKGWETLEQFFGRQVSLEDSERD